MLINHSNRRDQSVFCSPNRVESTKTIKSEAAEAHAWYITHIYLVYEKIEYKIWWNFPLKRNNTGEIESLLLAAGAAGAARRCFCCF